MTQAAQQPAQGKPASPQVGPVKVPLKFVGTKAQTLCVGPVPLRVSPGVIALVESGLVETLMAIRDPKSKLPLFAAVTRGKGAPPEKEIDDE